MFEDICSEYGVNAEQAEALDINKNCTSCGSGVRQDTCARAAILDYLLKFRHIFGQHRRRYIYQRLPRNERKIRQEFALRLEKLLNQMKEKVGNSSFYHIE